MRWIKDFTDAYVRQLLDHHPFGVGATGNGTSAGAQDHPAGPRIVTETTMPPTSPGSTLSRPISSGIPGSGANG